MLKICRTYTVFLFIMLLAVTSINAENYLYHEIYATILVADPDTAADLIAKWSEDVGGYYLVKSSSQVIIRFPYEKVSALKEYLEQIADDVVEISIQAFDRREELSSLQAGINSRDQILKQNLAFMNKADTEGALAIEQEIILLLEAIEGLTARLERIKVEIEYSWAQINLNFMEQSIPQNIASSFNWINSIDFYQFMAEGN